MITFLYFHRSLIAAYLLVLNGYNNVFHLEGGLYKWFKEDLPAVAEEWNIVSIVHAEKSGPSFDHNEDADTRRTERMNWNVNIELV